MLLLVFKDLVNKTRITSEVRVLGGGDELQPTDGPVVSPCSKIFYPTKVRLGLG